MSLETYQTSKVLPSRRQTLPITARRATLALWGRVVDERVHRPDNEAEGRARVRLLARSFGKGPKRRPGSSEVLLGFPMRLEDDDLYRERTLR